MHVEKLLLEEDTVYHNPANLLILLCETAPWSGIH